LKTPKYKILVTGSAGFIGAHLVTKLISLGHTIVGLDNINDYYDQNLKYERLLEHGIAKDIKYDKVICSSKYENYKFIKMNIEDKINLKKLFHNEKFNIVCNLAGQAGVRHSIKNPDIYIDSNIVGFMNMLEACREFKIKNFLYASSSSVYGLEAELPSSTTDITDTPISIYAATKKANELMAHTYAHLYKIKTTGLRFFSVYGPWARPDMALHTFVKAAFSNKSIDIYNNAQMLRDFTYIDDVIEMTIRSIDKQFLKKESFTKAYKILNIGSSKPIRLMDFIVAIEDKLGFNIKKNYLPLQSGDVINTCADMSDSIKDLGYIPQTSLQDGVSNFIDWYIDFYNIKEKKVRL
jgi:UDP-glucuronate 4-epimerase